MYRKKSLIRRLLPWLIAAVLLACLIIFVFVPIYSQKEDTNSNPPVIGYYEGDEKPLTMENDALLFTMDPTTTRFQITEKVSGRVWDSTPADAEKDPIALTANKEMLSATLLVGYTTSSGEIILNNNAYAIQNQSYEIKQQEDGSIRVDYSVGQIERKNVLLPLRMRCPRRARNRPPPIIRSMSRINWIRRITRMKSSPCILLLRNSRCIS